MNAKDFIARVVPDDGLYFIGELTGTRYMQKPVKSDDELEFQIQRLQKKHANVFYSTGTFNNEDSRKASNVKSKKCLYVDLDCKDDDKNFKDKHEATQELQKFMAAIGMPVPSLLVDSGNGFHAYWVLTEAISAMEWQILANGLQNACEAHGFKVDPNCTVDAARILRVPGTWNYKDEANPKQCKVILEKPDVDRDQITNALKGYLRPLGVITGTAPPLPGAEVNPEDLGEVPKVDFYAKNIFDQCPTMGHVYETGGQCQEPLWTNTLNVLAFCIDGENFMHEVSSKDRRYTEAETEKKFLYCKENSKGPTRCVKFAGLAGSKCSICTHRTGGTDFSPTFDITSPISLGRPTAKDLPSGYVATDCAIYRRSAKDGELVHAISGNIDDLTIAKDEDDNWYSRIKLTHGKDTGTYRFMFVELGDERGFRVRCLEQGLCRSDREFKELKELMSTWQQQMKAAKIIGTTPSRLGWLKEDDRIGYTLGNETVWEDGTSTPFSMPANSVIDQYIPKGKLDKWRKAADIVAATPSLQVALASGFASPLMELTGVSGAVLAIVSAKSGTGKTSAMRVAQAIWGCPRIGINSLSDTQLSIAKRLGIINNMPAYWDELHLKDDVKSFAKLVFQLGQGKEKSRLNSNASMQAAGKWETLITVASNESIADGMQYSTAGTDAGMARVLEVEVHDSALTADQLPRAMQAFKQLDYNYGIAGQEYAKYLVANRKVVYDQVRATMDKVADAVEAQQSDRFLIATMSALLVGASIANKLGLMNFDVKAMAKILMDSYKLVKEETKDIVCSPADSIKQVIAEFQAESVDHTVVVEHLRTPGRFADIGTIKQPKFAPIRIQMAQQDQIMLIDHKQFSHWLNTTYGAARRHIRAALQLPGVIETKANLSFGTEFFIPKYRARVLKVPYSAMDI